VPIVFAAIRAGNAPKVYGNDYATDDGSCVRDYVHVQDLSSAHLAAIDYLNSAESNSDVRPETTFNVGTGKGSSVFEVIEEIKKVSGIDFKEEVVDRRAGDPPFLCADVSRIKNVLGWTAKHDLHDIVASAWNATK
jgi:UDP-glucose 4-epimerase